MKSALSFSLVTLMLASSVALAQTTFETPAPASTPLEGQVSTTTPAPETAKDFIEISLQPAMINPNLKENFDGYQIIVKNKHTADYIEVFKAEVQNAVDSQAAAGMLAEQAQERAGRRRFASGLIRGVGGALPGVAAWGGVGSWGAYRAAGIASNVAEAAATATDASAGVGATGAAEAYQFVKQGPTGMMSPQDQNMFRSLVPRGQQPFIKVIFKNARTGQMFTYNQQ